MTRPIAPEEVARLIDAFKEVDHVAGRIVYSDASHLRQKWRRALGDAVERSRRLYGAIVCASVPSQVAETPAALLTITEIESELSALERRWDDLRRDDERAVLNGEDEGAAGSPGEWMVERMGELEQELIRRNRALAL